MPMVHWELSSALCTIEVKPCINSTTSTPTILALLVVYFSVYSLDLELDTSNLVTGSAFITRGSLKDSAVDTPKVWTSLLTTSGH